MKQPQRAARLLALGTALAVSGCTLSTTKYETCETNAECQDAFGWGHTCGEAGLCQVVEQHPRCEETEPADLFENREAYADHILLGINFDLSQFGLEAKSMALAVNQANESEGLDGRPYALVQCTTEEDLSYDNLDNEGANAEVTRFLAGDLGVPAIMGPATSGRTEAAYLIAAPEDTLTISPSATSPALTTLDGLTCSDSEPGLLWRTAPPDDLQGQVMAQDLIDRDIRSVAVIFQEGPYGAGLQEAFSANFEGGSRSADLFQYAEGNASQRDTAVADVAYGDYEEVIFISSDKTDIVAFLLGAAASGRFEAEDIGIMLSDAAYDEGIFDDASDADALFDQVRGTRPSTQLGQIYDAFAVAFAAYYGEDASSAGFTAYAYDAAWMVLYGTAWAEYNEGGEMTGTNIARGLRKLSKGDDVDVRATSWSTIRANFSEGRSVDIAGASGQLDFDSETCETSAPIEVWAVSYEVGEGYVFSEIDTVFP